RDSHRSRQTLQTVAQNLASTKLPALLLWGAKDPVFLDRYQHDLLNRIDTIDIHRFNTAGHMLAEDRDIVTPIFGWIKQQLDDTTPVAPDPTSGKGSAATGDYVALWEYLDRWSDSKKKAMVDMTVKDDSGKPVDITWQTLSSVVNAMALGLRDAGMRPGDRVSMLVQPGRDLT